MRISVSFVPGRDFEAVERRLIENASERPKTHLRSVLRMWMPLRVAEALCAAVNVSPETESGRLSRDARRRLVRALIEWTLPVRGTRGYNHAEVTAGGVPLAEIDSKSMASRVCDGLHLVGEILDVDGRIGGFNFQWAWSSGYVAGTAVAGRLKAAASGRDVGGQRQCEA